MFATMHPRPIVGKPSAPSLPSEMLLTLMLSLVSFTLLYLAFVRSRYRYAIQRDVFLERVSQNA
jgi:heme exporter protein C